MKKLLRNNVSHPACLTNLLTLESQQSPDITGAELWKKQQAYKCKPDIWVELNKLQYEYCAYCERSIDDTNHHIDHFFPKGPNRAQTFNWDNLFGSCNNQRQICGHKKGEQDPSNAIKPDIDDPSEFFQYSNTGEIQAKENLNQIDSLKAIETIRIFNLNDTYLINLRSRKYETYMQRIKQLHSRTTDKNQWRTILTNYCNSQENKEFSGYMKYLLNKVISTL